MSNAAHRHTALRLANDRGLVPVDPPGDAGDSDLYGWVKRGVLTLEDALLLEREAELMVTGRYPGSGDHPTLVHGQAAPAEGPLLGLYPWRDWSRYKPEVFLGEGGMGRVFRVRDLKLQRTVAIKFFRGAGAGAAGLLLREAQAQARIDHPNVVTIHEAGEHEGIPFLSMPFIHGPSLGKAAGRMDLRDRVDAVRQAALGVQAAHQLGIVHRDLKPANIMVEPTGDGHWRAVVMDFGMARDLRDTPAGNTAVMGTPAYMSPEQVQGPSVLIGPHSDVYALGVTLFEVLVGHPPFQSSSHAEVLRMVVEAEAPPLRSLDPALPAELEAIVQRCLEKDVLRRYDTAQALAEDLARFLEGRPVLARPVGPVLRTLRRIRRNPLPATAAAAVLVLAAGWLSYALVSRARVRDLDSRMAAQQADLARLQGQLDHLRQRQEEEQRRSDELARRMVAAATTQERAEVEAQLRTSQERERELARQVEEARRRLATEAAAPVRSEPGPAPTAPPPPRPEPPRTDPSPSPAPVEPEPVLVAPQVLQQVPPVYPARARRLPSPTPGQDVTVLVRVSVDAQGRCQDVAVLAGVPGRLGFDEAAVEAMRRSTYAPALRGGKPVPGTLDVRVRFPRR